jgi:diguanylate cyclase (GGDEF)-like protein
MAAWSLVSCGALVVIGVTLGPSLDGVDARASIAVGLATTAFGLLTRLCPWDRWPARASLAIAVVALGLSVAGYSLTGWAEQTAAAYTYAVFYLLLFGWVGLSQPPGTSAWLTPFAAGAYVVPLSQAPDPIEAMWALLFMAPVGALLGELVAWTMSRAASAAALDASRAADLEALLSAATELQAAGDPSETSDRVAAVASELLEAEGAVVLVREGDGHPVFDGAHNIDTTSGLQAALDEAAVEEVLSTGEIVLTGSKQRDGVSRPVLLFPLVGREGPIGAVVVHGPARLVDPFTTHLLSLFGVQAGTALERRQVIGELTDQAMRDSLTGVGNRRHASGLLSSVRPGDAVVLVDLDHFKRVNDTEGHATGDLVLAQLGLYLRNAVREADAVARYGGEEFLVVLRDLPVAADVAVQRLVEDWRISCTKATISAGVAVHVAGTNAVETLNRADEALYHAKRTGRDRASAWRADLAASTPPVDLPAGH